MKGTSLPSKNRSTLPSSEMTRGLVIEPCVRPSKLKRRGQDREPQGYPYVQMYPHGLGLRPSLWAQLQRKDEIDHVALFFESAQQISSIVLQLTKTMLF